MDTNSHPDDLTGLERRLAAWSPSGEGLDADAMLFAAGQADARRGPGRLAWPALACLMTVLSAGLGAWVAAERTARLNLARQLQGAPASPTPFAVDNPSEPPTADDLTPLSAFALHRALDQGLDAWPPQPPTPAEGARPAPPEPPILQVGQRDTLIEP
jgi:hypothetical protein